MTTLEKLKKRKDFLRIAGNGQKYIRPTLVLQAMKTEAANENISATSPIIRLGFTATRKLGGAVIRNRIRRRLKEAARQLAPLYGQPGNDYVIIGRQRALEAPFSEIQNDMRQAFTSLKGKLKSKDEAPK